MPNLFQLKDFARSYFSIGSGLSIMPLMRFSHLSQDFIFCNLFMSREQVKSWYLKAIDRSHDLVLMDLQEWDSFDETKDLELPDDYLQYLQFPTYFTQEERQNYLRMFRPAIEEPSFAFKFKLHRKSVKKDLNLYYVCTEGFAILNLLSQGGKVRMPRVVETIQTGRILDDPVSGLLSRWLSQEQVIKDWIWVRGHEPNYQPWAKRNNAIEAAGPFSSVAMDVSSDWWAGDFRFTGNPKYTPNTKRYVKAFIQPAWEQSMRALFPIQVKKTKIWVNPLESLLSHMKECDVLVIPASLKSKIQGFHGKVLSWEQMGYSHIGHYIFQEASEMVHQLKIQLEQMDIDEMAEVFVIPQTTEDQGPQFLNALQSLTQPSHLIFLRAFEAYASVIKMIFTNQNFQ